jgi:hypothetical protein
MFDFSQALILALAGAFRENKSLRGWVLAISVVVLIGASMALLYTLFSPPYLSPYRSNIIGIGVGLMLVGFGAFTMTIFSFVPETELRDALQPDEFILRMVANLGKSNIQRSLETEPHPAREVRDRAKEPYDIIESIQSNLGQLLEYYIINKGQAKSSFRASTMSIAVGFLTIIGGIWLSYSGRLSDNSAVYISVLAGVVLQFIGAAYFYLYNRSLMQLNFFFNRLALMQDTLLAIRLTDSIPEGDVKHKVLEKLIFTIVTRDPKTPQYELTTKSPALSGSSSDTKPAATDAA